MDIITYLIIGFVCFTIFYILNIKKPPQPFLHIKQENEIMSGLHPKEEVWFAWGRKNLFKFEHPFLEPGITTITLGKTRQEATNKLRTAFTTEVF